MCPVCPVLSNASHAITCTASFKYFPGRKEGLACIHFNPLVVCNPSNLFAEEARIYIYMLVPSRSLSTQGRQMINYSITQGRAGSNWAIAKWKQNTFKSVSKDAKVGAWQSRHQLSLIPPTLRSHLGVTVWQESQFGRSHMASREKAMTHNKSGIVSM